MSLDINMEKYGSGAMTPDSQSNSDTNLYQEVEEFPVQKELLDSPQEAEVAAPEPEVNPQAENFRALREEVDRIKTEREAEKREHQAQLEMLRANLSQKQQEVPEQHQKKMFEGMEDSDVPNVRELRTEWERREAEYQTRLEELQVAQMHPDYAEVIEKYAVPLVKQKPHLAEGLQGARNKALFAYELGKMAQQMQTPAPEPVRSENAERIVANSKKPGTLSQAGGQAALSKADYFATMSDSEFMKFAGRNLEGI